MSSQCANSAVMVAAETGSLAVMFSTVRSEKTTPQPKVTPGALRSKISISCAGSRSFIEMAKYRPAGPPPMQAIFIRRSRKKSQTSESYARARMAPGARGPVPARRSDGKPGTASAAAWHSSAPLGQPSAARIDAADEGADERVERIGTFEVGQVAGAFDRVILRAGDELGQRAR